MNYKDTLVLLNLYNKPLDFNKLTLHFYHIMYTNN